jgi:hypothetical protein
MTYVFLVCCYKDEAYYYDDNGLIHKMPNPANPEDDILLVINILIRASLGDIGGWVNSCSDQNDREDPMEFFSQLADDWFIRV